MGLNDIESPDVQRAQTENKENTPDDDLGDVMDNRKLNDLIKAAMNKDKKD